MKNSFPLAFFFCRINGRAISLPFFSGVELEGEKRQPPLSSLFDRVEERSVSGRYFLSPTALHHNKRKITPFFIPLSRSMGGGTYEVKVPSP